jgi:hypothetical protein
MVKLGLTCGNCVCAFEIDSAIRVEAVIGISHVQFLLYARTSTMCLVHCAEIAWAGATPSSKQSQPF